MECFHRLPIAFTKPPGRYRGYGRFEETVSPKIRAVVCGSAYASVITPKAAIRDHFKTGH